MMLPVKPSRWMAALFPPVLGLNTSLAAGARRGSAGSYFPVLHEQRLTVARCSDRRRA